MAHVGSSNSIGCKYLPAFWKSHSKLIFQTVQPQNPVHTGFVNCYAMHFFYCLYSYYVKSKQTWIDLTSNNQMHLQSFDSKIPLNCINNNVFCRGKKKQFFIQIDIIIVSSNNWMGRYSTTECSANDWRCLMKIHLFKHIVKTNSSPTYMLNHCVCVYVYALHGMQTMIRFYCWFALCNNELVSSSAQKVFVCFHIRDANTKSF